MQIPQEFAGLRTVKARGRTYRYAWRGGPRIFGEPGTPEFREELARAAATVSVGAKRIGIKSYVTLNLFRGARKRARCAGIEFDLTPDFLDALLIKQEFNCAVTAIPFDLTRTGRNAKVFRHPFRPSIDRISCKRGYQEGNVRLVCWAVNMALSDWGDDVLLEIARGLTLQHGR